MDEEKKVSLTIVMAQKKHKNLKVHCANNKISIKDFIVDLIDKKLEGEGKNGVDQQANI